MKIVLTLIMMVFMLESNEISLTSEQEKNWKIKTDSVSQSENLPIGNYMMEVTVPPRLLQAITLGFETRINKLYVSLYQEVKKGDALVEVGGPAWIEAQKEALSNAIALKESRTVLNRKNRLCKEGIIPQKECVTANATLQYQEAKIAASRSVLETFGADKIVIEELINTLKIKQNLIIRAQKNAVITALHAEIGKSIPAGAPLMIMQESGALWLESELPLESVKQLKNNQAVHIMIEGETFESTVLQLSPIINKENQTRLIRFSLPEDAKLLSGLRMSGKITVKKPTLIVNKQAVIKASDGYVVFVKEDKGYTSVKVEVLAEDDAVYYLAENDAIKAEIAVSSLAALKSMMGE